MTESTFAVSPIGIIHSCFKEKFGIPRQPGLATAARATLEILAPYDRDEAFRGIEVFSHLWIIFVFHGIAGGQWRPTVRPPRLGGNRRSGVFATRSGFRPNRIGISVVALDGLDRRKGKFFLELSGIDLLDQTPVLDVKPYLLYADSIPHATGGFAADPPGRPLSLAFSEPARRACAEVEKTHPGFYELVIQVLGADPRPAYLDDSGRAEFGMRLYDFNVRWSVRRGRILVQAIEKYISDAAHE
jgi:tRNA-Thr(GGU) m(6)t(6)A37 methyltransferase TsaA